ncbi:polysaccharide biosynthesis C-terminal domain-containing protein [Lentimicrobium sp. S6]|uniref:oligosaccharide flippase family protein n=1 Tax=Lentimicrobium sp. S6 TaxID=2735872 RepID=UPI0015564CDA|nr:polysaccharide biosynthesis C-terminal domain-containing protein [Lentimicrobium sp. S6]NPD46900.1 oligosaccharide flippase family protein [Lentimicrobium sp. S6]
MLSIFKKADYQNTAWFLLEKLIQLIVGAFIVPQIFSSLGASNMGELKYAMTIIGVFAPIFSLGLLDISIREMIFHPKRTNAIISTSLYLQLGSWLLVFLGFAIFLVFSVDKSQFLLYAIIALSYLTRLSNIAEYFLLATKRVKYIFIAKILSLLIITLFQYYGVKNQYSIIYFAEITALDFIIQGLIYFVIFKYNNSIHLKLTRFSSIIAKTLLKSSYPLIITQFLLYLYLSLDKFFLKYYMDNEAIGQFYSVKFLVITLTWNFGFAIINALYPAIANSYKNNRPQYVRRMSVLLKTVSVYGLLIVIFYHLFGDYILSNYFNETDSETLNALKIFCWAPLIVFIGMIYEKHIINNNKLYKDAIRFAIGIIVNIIFSILLIPKYGISGAAISILVSHLVINIGYIFIDKESRRQAIYLLRRQ